MSAAERERAHDPQPKTLAIRCLAGLRIYVLSFADSISLSLVAYSTEKSFLAVGLRLSSVLERLLAELEGNRGTLHAT